MIRRSGENIFVGSEVKYRGTLDVGHCSTVGLSQLGEGPVVFRGAARIGRFCCVEPNTEIGDDFEMDDYCAVYAAAKIGRSVKLLYGNKIFGNAIVGDGCIVGGDIPERCILEPDVTFMGEVAHSHYNPNSDWDTTDEPSPVIGEGTVIGVNAILVGGIKIGKNCYVSAGEILRHDLDDGKVFIKGTIKELSDFRGLLKTRYSADKK